MWIVGLSRFVIVVVLRLLLQDEPELQPDEEGSWTVCSMCRGSACSIASWSRSWMCQCCGSWKKSWSLLLVRSSATLVQASGDSTGGRAHIEQIVDVPVPRMLEQHVDVIKVIPEEWMSKRIVQQIVDVPVPQIPKQIVEVVLVIFLLTACGKGAVGGTFRTCCPTAHPHTPGLILSASDGIWNMLFSTCSHTSRWVRFRFGGCLSLVVAHVRPTHITLHEHHVMA